MKITIPELSLVVLIGPSGSGKSTFARKHFKATEVLSSDFCRALVSDDENNQAATSDAFEVLRFIGAKRLAAAKLVVALCVPGNHDMKLVRKLRQRDVQITHGLADSLEQLEREPAGFKEQVASFLDDLVSHYVLDDGKLVVAHAGMKAEMQGRGSGKVRDFALYGETTGETDEFGLPIRYNWAAEYRGRAMVVYGHTPVPEPEWLNRTINIDRGCVFGGKLTALRYPEKGLVSGAPASIALDRKQRAIVAGRVRADHLQRPEAGLPHSLRPLAVVQDVLRGIVVHHRINVGVGIRVEVNLRLVSSPDKSSACCSRRFHTARGHPSRRSCCTWPSTPVE